VTVTPLPTTAEKSSALSVETISRVKRKRPETRSSPPKARRRSLSPPSGVVTFRFSVLCS
jgi:hypothetical protein